VPLTLTGTNFGTGSATTITLGGAACTSVASTHDRLTCTLPPGEGTAQAIVVSVASASASTSYDYAAPVLTGLSPAQLPAAGGATLTLAGSNFGLTPSVTVGGAACPVTARTHQQVTCTSPAGVATQAVVLTVGGQASGSLSVNYVGLTVSSVSPGTVPARGGSVVLIEGTGLSQATITIAGAACQVIKATDTSVACVVPATPAGAATVTVTANGSSASLQGLAFVASCGVDLAEGASCDDGNPCTGLGHCAGTSCVSGAAANEGTACDDGNACTGAGVCTSGACVASAGNAGVACVDTAPCTGAGLCAAGVCGQSTPAREGLACGPVAGATCVAGACTAPPDAGVVDAGVADAGVGDAGVADAGVIDFDAGVIEDGGTVDGGELEDGGVADAGAADAGATADAGFADGGTGNMPGDGTGCGCTSTPGVLWLGLLALVALRRARR